jgi:hypothetical protein
LLYDTWAKRWRRLTSAPDIDFSCKAFISSVVFRVFLFRFASAYHCRFSGESVKAMFSTVRGTQNMHLYDRSDHFMLSEIERDE